MNKLKKLVICAVTLCATVSAFGLKIEEHPASRRAQKQLENQMLTYLQQGKAKDIEKLFKHLPKCDGETYKDNQTPTRCQSWYEDVVEVEVESATQPGYFKKEKVKITTVNPTAAFKKAAEKYFVLEKNPSYLDYNKMYTFYVQNKDSWAADVLYSWTDKGSSFAMNAFKVKADYFRHTPDRIAYIVVNRSYQFYKTASEWGKVATDVYNDRDTFYQTKWAIFKNVMFTFGAEGYSGIYLCDLVDTIAWREFWDAFAIAPLGKDKKVRDEQRKKIRDLVRKAYPACFKIEKEHNFYWSLEDCETIREQAIKYGYWYSPEELANLKKMKEDNKRREVGFRISSHLHK